MIQETEIAMSNDPSYEWRVLPPTPPTVYRTDTLLLKPGNVPVDLEIINKKLGEIGLKLLGRDDVAPDLQRLTLQATTAPYVDAWQALRRLRSSAASDSAGAPDPAVVVRISLEYLVLAADSSIADGSIADSSVADSAVADSSVAGGWTAASSTAASSPADSPAAGSTSADSSADDGTEGGAYSPSGPPK